LSTIIDRITEAEEKADRLRKDAAAKAREAVTRAESKISEEKNKERQAGPARLREASEKAQLEGEKAAERIMQEARAKTGALCSEARKRLPAAVSYLMERVVKA
jgi:V/A-type H+-transporting ATPase subunit G/H